ncbi:FHA domain-containing protein [Arsenicicoccus dermatophilus]|uniref:FHA domain-containing protein n=1 Tax=Arsenicicoccus dermatophilus TaxID=1076331 RepID=UPI003916D139
MSNPSHFEGPTTQQFHRVGSEPLDVLPDVERGLTTQDQATVDALRPGTALLVVLRGPNTGARFLLDADEVSAGRHPDSDIFLDDVTVSRRHAVFVRVGDTFEVRDAGSLNGTYVNRERSDAGRLQAGDEVQIGKFRLVFYAPSSH